MGQIVIRNQKPKYCNLVAITTGTHATDVPAAGEVWLIDTTNSSKTNGSGKYDKYIIGDNSHTASQLASNPETLFSIDNAQVIDIDSTPTSGSTNAVSSNGVYQAIQAIDVSSQISGKADKSEMSVVAGTGANADKTTITLKSGTSATVLTQHQDISGKQDTISDVTVAVDANTGTPSGTATFNNNTLELSFSNLKGEKGDTGSTGAQGIQGPAGPQGPKGDTGATGDTASLIMVQEVDETTPYEAATDVAGAAAAQKLMLDGIDDEEVIARALVELKSYQEDGYAFKGIANTEMVVPDQIQNSVYIVSTGVHNEFDGNGYVVPEHSLGLVAWDGTTWNFSVFPLYSQDTKIFKGIVRETDTISTPVQKVSYLAMPGIYTQFGETDLLVPDDNIGIISWDGTSWTLSVYPTTLQDVVIDDFTDWEYGSQDTYGNWEYNTTLFKYKYLKVFAGQTIYIKTGGYPANPTTGLTKIILANTDSTIIGRATGAQNILNTFEYTSPKTQYYYVCVRVSAGSGFIPPIVKLTYNYSTNIKKNNVVGFGKGEEWEDVVSALELKDKNIVTEKDANIVSGTSYNPASYASPNAGHRFIFENDNYKYLYVIATTGTYYRNCAYGFYTDSTVSSETLIEGDIFQNLPSKNGVCIIKRVVPENCKYIQVLADNQQSLGGPYNKVFLFRDTSLVSIGFALDNFALHSGAILDSTKNVSAVYGRYTEYIQLRNNLGKINNNTNSTFRCIFLSDIHGKKDIFKRIVSLTNEWASDGYVDAMILTGDVAFDVPTESYEWFHKQRAICKVDILTLPGNHDWSSSGVTGDKERTYNNIIAPMVNGITVNEGEENEYVAGQVENIIQPSDALENHRLYYYKDYGSIRFIAIYRNVDSEDQLTWLQTVLADAITNNKVVIIGNHCGFAYSIAKIKYDSAADFYENCPNTFFTADGSLSNTGVNPYGSDTPLDAPYVAAVKTFMDNGGTFICWLTGHSHRDHFYDVIDHNLYGYQFMLNTCAASNHGAVSDVVKIGNTDEIDCYNYLSIDLTRHLIKLLRIGVNTDNIGRGRTVFVYDYVNHKVVANY